MQLLRNILKGRVHALHAGGNVCVMAGAVAIIWNGKMILSWEQNMKSHTEDNKTLLSLSDFFNVRQKQAALNHCVIFVLNLM